jgi:H-type small acid-soluble spore protein
MDAHRAKEIFDSDGYIDVRYKGKPVLINEIHEYSDTALVKGMEDKDSNLIEVELSDLSETKE